MTLKDLSEKVNLSVSFLSGIERDIYSPSLETVSMLSEIFDISISNLLGEGDRHRIKLIRRSERKVYEDERSKLEFLSKHQSLDTRLELKRIEVEPKTHQDKWIHSHSGEEIIQVLEGSACINVGGNVYCLSKDDSIHFDASILHGFENKEDAPLKMLICTSPSCDRDNLLNKDRKTS